MIIMLNIESNYFFDEDYYYGYQIIVDCRPD